MSTKNSNVTFGDFVSATRAVSNKDATDKKFNINANVKVANGQVTGFENGFLTNVENPTLGNGSFNSGENFSHFGFNCNNFTPEQIKEAVTAIVDFCLEVIDSITNQTEE